MPDKIGNLQDGGQESNFGDSGQEGMINRKGNFSDGGQDKEFLGWWTGQGIYDLVERRKDLYYGGQGRKFIICRREERICGIVIGQESEGEGIVGMKY